MLATETPTRYTSKQICQLADISHRQLIYWVSKRYLRPASYYSSGRPYTFTTREAFKAIAIARMLQDGIALWKAADLVNNGRYALLVELPFPEGGEVDG